jgi:hypothetical protein
VDGVIAQPRGIGRGQTTVARARLDAAIDGIPREDRIGGRVPAHQFHVDVIRGQTTHPDANRRETEPDAIAVGHLRTARVKRAMCGVETITLAPAQIIVQPRARELAPDLEIDLLVILAQPSHVALAPSAEPLEKVGHPGRDARASGCGVTLISAGLDEVPMVYKNIHEVMAAQSDLVEVIGQFDPKLVKMAPHGERPED